MSVWISNQKVKILSILLTISVVLNIFFAVLYYSASQMNEKLRERIIEFSAPEYYVNSTKTYAIGYGEKRLIYCNGTEFPITISGVIKGDGNSGPHYTNPSSTAWKEYRVFLVKGCLLRFKLYWNDTSQHLDLYLYYPGKAPSEDGTGEDYYLKTYESFLSGYYIDQYINKTGNWTIGIDIYTGTTENVEFKVTIEVLAKTPEEGIGFISAFLLLHATGNKEDGLFQCEGIDRLISVLTLSINFSFLSFVEYINYFRLSIAIHINRTEILMHEEKISLYNMRAIKIISLSCTFEYILDKLSIPAEKKTTLKFYIKIHIAGLLSQVNILSVAIRGKRIK